MKDLMYLEKQSIATYTEKAYLDYSMYVILDRALPHLADGLKPVQRRIIYAMSELGLKAQAKFKKSARTVGDVLGKFHPHGDTACYEAMVLMAQPFSMRYPYVQGQGNWGSSDDPKSFAAMRYTESKLSAYAEVLLSELEQGTVDWGLNFDGSLKEPKLLPARLPNVLLNGATGIAVGMATDIVPHNAEEIGKACIALIDNPKLTISELMNFIKGPDFPSDAEVISPKEELLSMYESGQGSVKMRAVYNQEKDTVVISALPYMASGAKILQQIAEQMQAKKLPMLVNLRDESDHENPTRLVLMLRSNRVDTQALMSHLFATTDLEKNYRVNFNLVGLNGKPKVHHLKQLLVEWLVFREQVVVKRLNFQLEKVTQRLHIVDGLIIAFLNIDEVIHIIRTQEQPKPKLMKKFKLTDTQAEAILELKLRHLAKLEEEKLRAEQAKLDEEKLGLEKTLHSNVRLKTLMKKEIQTAINTYGDKRRSKIVEREEAKVLELVNKPSKEPVTVVLSEKGWIRLARGHDLDPKTLTYKSGDRYLASAKGTSDLPVVVLESTGRAFTLKTESLPSVRGHGEPLSSKVKIDSMVKFQHLMMEGNLQQRYWLCQSSGYGFATEFEQMLSKNKSGKALVNMSQGSELLQPLQMVGEATKHPLYLMLVSQLGRLLLCPLDDLPHMPKGKGKRLMQISTKALLSSKDAVILTAIVDLKQGFTLHSGKKKTLFKGTTAKEYIDEVGSQGKFLPKGLQKVSHIEITDSTK